MQGIHSEQWTGFEHGNFYGNVRIVRDDAMIKKARSDVPGKGYIFLMIIIGKKQIPPDFRIIHIRPENEIV